MLSITLPIVSIDKTSHSFPSETSETAFHETKSFFTHGFIFFVLRVKEGLSVIGLV